MLRALRGASTKEVRRKTSYNPGVLSIIDINSSPTVNTTEQFAWEKSQVCDSFTSLFINRILSTRPWPPGQSLPPFSMLHTFTPGHWHVKGFLTSFTLSLHCTSWSISNSTNWPNVDPAQPPWSMSHAPDSVSHCDPQGFCWSLRSCLLLRWCDCSLSGWQQRGTIWLTLWHTHHRLWSGHSNSTRSRHYCKEGIRSRIPALQKESIGICGTEAALTLVPFPVFKMLWLTVNPELTAFLQSRADRPCAQRSRHELSSAA